MKNLENIPKKNIYEVPDGYFDKLPGMIQARISTEAPENKPFFVYALRFVIPVLLIGIVSYVFWVNGNKQSENVEELLASIETPYLVDYLEEAGVTDDELAEDAELTETDLEEIEGMVYFGLDDQNPENEELYNQLKKEYTED